MLTRYTAVFLIAVIISSFSQALLKISANKKHETVIKEYLNFYVVCGYCLFLGCVLLSSFAYKGIQFKQGAVLESMGYVFILTIDRIVFNQRISKNKLIGSAIIILGILVFFM